MNFESLIIASVFFAWISFYGFTNLVRSVFIQKKIIKEFSDKPNEKTNGFAKMKRLIRGEIITLVSILFFMAFSIFIANMSIDVMSKFANETTIAVSKFEYKVIIADGIIGILSLVTFLVMMIKNKKAKSDDPYD